MLADLDKTPLFQYAGKGEHTHDRVAIVTAKWNVEIIEQLYQHAVDTFNGYGVSRIVRYEVPGAFELPLAAKCLAASQHFDSVVCLGCVIRGETRHNEYINAAVSDAIMRIGLEHKLPIIFGVLTTENLAQARERSDGTHGNKGIEAAVAALEMIDLMRRIK